MKIESLQIKNFKSIQSITITDIENVLILVGKNNTGKTVILDAIRALAGKYTLSERDFNIQGKNIVISVQIRLFPEDYAGLHSQGLVSRYKRFDLWKKDFAERLPSCKDDVLFIEMTVNPSGLIRYSDGYKKHNPYIPEVLPNVYHIDSSRNFSELQNDIILSQDDTWMNRLRNDKCMFDLGKNCNRCFRCIGLIREKQASDLNVLESARLLEYNLYEHNLNQFTERVNECFDRNGGHGMDIRYCMNFQPDDICRVNGYLHQPERNLVTGLDSMSNGMRCIYILSLLEVYCEQTSQLPCIILMEDPEIFLHPELQKAASEILYRLSKKNQVCFSTHSPNMLFNFTSAQIRQVTLDTDGFTITRSDMKIDAILDDLGYAANDLMNVNFVFFVEGTQDRSRLPLLLNKYYSEVIDEAGKPFRIAIITTNSCTNIKTYANLKYMNQLYLKDRFLMIRDGDGKDPEQLAGSLCRYYEERGAANGDSLPRVKRKNILILKYYSFENYFLNPELMYRIGVIPSVESFYQTLYVKWTDYLYKIKSGRNFTEKTGITLGSPQDIKEHEELFKIYLRGHNLFDIFYGPYRAREQELLTKYVSIAPKKEFSDILTAIDKFIYFENRSLPE